MAEWERCSTITLPQRPVTFFGPFGKGNRWLKCLRGCAAYGIHCEAYQLLLQLHACRGAGASAGAMVKPTLPGTVNLQARDDNPWPQRRLEPQVLANMDLTSACGASEPKS